MPPIQPNANGAPDFRRLPGVVMALEAQEWFSFSQEHKEGFMDGICRLIMAPEDKLIEAMLNLHDQSQILIGFAQDISSQNPHVGLMRHDFPEGYITCIYLAPSGYPIPSPVAAGQQSPNTMAPRNAMPPNPMAHDAMPPNPMASNAMPHHSSANSRGNTSLGPNTSHQGSHATRSGSAGPLVRVQRNSGNTAPAGQLPAGDHPEAVDLSLIPRPTNSWILFRAYGQRELRKLWASVDRTVAQGVLSSILKIQWSDLLPEDQKNFWSRMERRESALHKSAYPNYKCRLVKKGKDNDNDDDDDDGALEEKGKPKKLPKKDLPGFLNQVEVVEAYHKEAEAKNWWMLYPIPEDHSSGLQRWNVPGYDGKPLVQPSDLEETGEKRKRSSRPHDRSVKAKTRQGQTARMESAGPSHSSSPHHGPAPTLTSQPSSVATQPSPIPHFSAPTTSHRSAMTSPMAPGMQEPTNTSPPGPAIPQSVPVSDSPLPTPHPTAPTTTITHQSPMANQQTPSMSQPTHTAQHQVSAIKQPAGNSVTGSEQPHNSGAVNTGANANIMSFWRGSSTNTTGSQAEPTTSTDANDTANEIGQGEASSSPAMDGLSDIYDASDIDDNDDLFGELDSPATPEAEEPSSTEAGDTPGEESTPQDQTNTPDGSNLQPMDEAEADNRPNEQWDVPLSPDLTGEDFRLNPEAEPAISETPTDHSPNTMSDDDQADHAPAQASGEVEDVQDWPLVAPGSSDPTRDNPPPDPNQPPFLDPCLSVETFGLPMSDHSGTIDSTDQSESTSAPEDSSEASDSEEEDGCLRGLINSENLDMGEDDNFNHGEFFRNAFFSEEKPLQSPSSES
ncbi:hypothetical protein GGR53DRAFT_525591 [Hypoxylon sp. FL1150]|nr:hypothetical protein GGR53DRAFT_525591 [Hypoxylon sp. FL1150]